MIFPWLSGRTRFGTAFWTLVVISLLGTFTTISFTLFLSPFLKTVTGLPTEVVGSVFTVAQLAGLLCYLVAGPLVDQLGRRRTFLVSVFGQLISMVLLFSGVSSANILVIIGALTIFFPAQVLSGVAQGSMIADLIQPDKRTEAYAIQRIGVNLGFAAAPIAGGFLALRSYSAVFLLPLLSVTISVVIVVALLRETYSTGSSPIRAFRISGLKDALQDKVLVKFSLVTLFFQLAYAQFIVPVTVYATTVGITPVELGYLYTFNGLLVIALQYPLIRFFKNRAETETLAIGCAFYAAGLFSIGFAHSLLSFALSVIIITLGEIITLPSGLSVVSQLSSIDKRGRYLSLFGLFNRLGFSLGPFTGTTILAIFSNSSILAWAAIASFAAIASSGYWILQREVATKIKAMLAQNVAAPKI